MSRMFIIQMTLHYISTKINGEINERQSKAFTVIWNTVQDSDDMVNNTQVTCPLALLLY